MKIFCIANNYPRHNKAPNGALFDTEEPVFFMKPDSALLAGGKPFFVPDHLGHIDVEAHIVVRICRLGKTIPERFAHRYWDAMTLGLDFTARSLPERAQAQGLPWTMAKALDGSAVTGTWIEKDVLPVSACFCCKLDGQLCCQADTAHMRHSIDSMIACLSRNFTLKQGDLLFTGSPVPPTEAVIGGTIEGWIEERQVLHCRLK